MDVVAAAKAHLKFLPQAGTGRAWHQVKTASHAITAEHIEEMIGKIMTGEVHGEKAHRWLGFIQGVICARGAATLDELKQVNFTS